MDRNNAEIFISIGLTQIFAEKYWHAFHSFSTALPMIETLNETDYLSYGLIYRGLGQIYEKSGKSGKHHHITYKQKAFIKNVFHPIMNCVKK